MSYWVLPWLSTLNLAVALAVAPGAADPAPQQAVAVVASLAGEARVAAPPQMTPKPLHLFDWLEAGAEVEVLPGGHVVLAFASGERFQLDPKAKVVLTAAGPEAREGKVVALRAVPPLPRIAAIATAANAGAEPGAVRVLRAPGRSERIRNLYPGGGASAVADRTTLRFSRIEGATYRIEIEDQAGRRVFEAETASAHLDIPPGILKPEARYYWKVRTVETVGVSVRGEAEFVTLGSEDAERRAALKQALDADAEAGSLALLAAIDERLGLLWEARGQFRRAVEKQPANAAHKQALAALEARLSPEPSPPED